MSAISGNSAPRLATPAPSTSAISTPKSNAQAEKALAAAVDYFKKSDPTDGDASLRQAADLAATPYKALDVAEEAHDLGDSAAQTYAFGVAATLAVAAKDLPAAMDVARQASALKDAAAEGDALTKALTLCQRSDQALKVASLATADGLTAIAQQAQQKAGTLPKPGLWDHIKDFFSGIFHHGYHRQVPPNATAPGTTPA